MSNPLAGRGSVLSSRVRRKNGTGTGGSGSRVFNGVLTGTFPGTSFTLPEDIVSGTEHVFLNGVLQEEGVTCDYVLSESGGVGTGFDTVTFAFTIIGSDNLTVDYEPSP